MKIPVNIEETERKFNSRPWEAVAQQMQTILEGISIDYTPADHGEEPEHVDYPITSGDNGPY